MSRSASATLGMDCEVQNLIWPIVHVGTHADTFEEGSIIGDGGRMNFNTLCDKPKKGQY